MQKNDTPVKWFLFSVIMNLGKLRYRKNSWKNIVYIVIRANCSTVLLFKGVGRVKNSSLACCRFSSRSLRSWKFKNTSNLLSTSLKNFAPRNNSRENSNFSGYPKYVPSKKNLYRESIGLKKYS